MSSEEQESRRNFKAFIWHAAFLALASNFMDVDTVIPAMLVKVGGNSIHMGILTTIMIGGGSFMQLFFSGVLSNKAFKKKFLLGGINLRVMALLSLSLLFLYSDTLTKSTVFISIFVLISIFSFSGSFANVSYIDILGKTISQKRRKQFFSLKQFISSIGLLSSAFLAGYVLKRYAFPTNYSYTYLFAALLLLIASIGFYFLSEKVASTSKKIGIKEFFTQMPKEIKRNSHLKYYLIIINFMGIGVSLLPFVVLLAKENQGINFSLIGTFIIFRTAGMLIGSLSLYFMSKKFKYKYVLLFDVFLGASIPILALLLQQHLSLFPIIFTLAGIFISTFKISLNGMLIEISTNENRTLYAGMSGAGNILTSIFPLVAGVLIQFLGFNIVFSLISMSILMSYFAVRKIQL
jgi:MFS family permease